MECKYCHNIFNTPSAMVYHQKSARYCLELQGKNEKSHTCQCGKNYSRKSCLQRHQETCIYALDREKTPDATVTDDIEQITQNQTQNKQFEGTMMLFMQNVKKMLQEFEQRGNRLQGLDPITDEKLKAFLDNLTLDYILKGARGYANYANTYPFKDKLICTDRSRKKLRYNDENGVASDNSWLLAIRFFAAIADKNKQLLNDEYERIQKRLNDIIAANKSGCEDVSSLLKRSVKIQELLISTENAAKGTDDAFIQDFLNQLTKITIN